MPRTLGMNTPRSCQEKTPDPFALHRGFVIARLEGELEHRLIVHSDNNLPSVFVSAWLRHNRYRSQSVGKSSDDRTSFTRAPSRAIKQKVRP
jgi:hypothetical protein